MLMAPLVYPNPILATATIRFRRRTRTSTRDTAAYRSGESDGGADRRLADVPLDSAAASNGPTSVELDGRILAGAFVCTTVKLPINFRLEHPRGGHRPPAQLHSADD